MSRTIPGGLAAAIAAQAVAPVMFVECDFQSGFVRMWSGFGPLVWNGLTWVGGGELMGISQIEETRSIEATSIGLTLSGVPSAMVSVAYNDFSQGRSCKVWLGAMDVTAGTVIVDPIQIFAGRMDTISDQDDGQTSTISVTAESNLTDLDRLRVRYFTDQDQQRIFGGDRSMRYMSSVQDRPINWGTNKAVGQPTATRL